MPIYTKNGDAGETGLFNGDRVIKSCNSINALGDLDELNASLGLARLHLKKTDSLKLAQIQKDLFTIGSIVAGFNIGGSVKKPLGSRVDWMEKEIDAMDRKLSPLRNFILPNGCESSTTLHLARAVCRRCERSLVSLGSHSGLIPYINRLSDYLFILARLENSRHKVDDELVNSNPR
ncbi:MAG: cob(I)yrinic acid a,c-diamide adenosyltransferase [Patescibacteria group bacterium]